MKFCMNCGAKLDDNDKFCVLCGAKCDNAEAKEEVVEEAHIVEQVEEEKPEEVKEEVVEEDSTEKPQEEAKVEETPIVEPIEENPNEEIKEEAKEEKPIIEETPKEDLILIKHAVFFTALLLGISMIYWIFGSFINIHVAIRVVLIFVYLGGMFLPVFEAVKYLIASIKQKKFHLFTIVTLGICQVLLFILFFISISVATS